MATLAEERPAGAAQSDFDVLVVGAGISGIGAAWHLQKQSPGRSFVVLESKDTFGGTWVTHKYPGIRSDSDLYTFGYRFKPWVGPPIATAAEILAYMNEVITENGIDKHIRYGHKIETASWSDADRRWTVSGTANGKPFTVTANFLWMCQGYYGHDKGYTPEWAGMENFKGPIIHPQNWPEDIDLSGKRVVVIGSGATAATLVPAIADKCAHVTLLQRSPTWFFPAPNANELADTLRMLEVDETWVHEIVRRKVLYDQQEMTRRSVEEPEAVKAELLEAARALLPEGFDIAKHFTPSYRPWQQRLAFIPEGDLFQGIAAGKASVVTDHIDRFTEKGILLKSGEELEADVIITATGFNLMINGGIDFWVNGKQVNLADTVTYRGMMFTGVPNMLWVMGYFRASWTLRVDLLGDFVTRLLNHMAEKGVTKLEVALRPEDKGMPLLPWIEADNFNPGYLMRGLHLLPKRGNKPEWMHNQDYWAERIEIPAIDIDGPEFQYS